MLLPHQLNSGQNRMRKSAQYKYSGVYQGKGTSAVPWFSSVPGTRSCPGHGFLITPRKTG